MPKRTEEVFLSGDALNAVLAIPVRLETEQISLGEVVSRASDLMRLANAVLQNNPLVRVAGEALLKNKGSEVMVSVGIDSRVRVHQASVSSNQERLPSLTQLRGEAVALGIDTSKLGRKKKLLIRLIDEASRRDGCVTI